MVLVDPLFQRQLVAQCRQRAIPVIFDEVLRYLNYDPASSPCHPY